MMPHFARSRSPITRLEVLCIAVAAGAYALYSRLQSGRRPGISTPEGFFGFYDQGEYLRIAERLAHFSLPSAAEYTYGLGYPLLAAPFSRLGFEGDPFLPVDVFAFAFVVAGVAVIGSRVSGRRCGLASAALLGLATPMLELITIPWNSTVGISCMVVALLVATSPNGPSNATMIVLGLAAGLSFAARYPDGLAIGLVGVTGLVGEPHRQALRSLTIATASAALLAIPVLATQHVILGSWTTTPYASHLRGEEQTSDQSLGQYDLTDVPRHAIETFVTARSAGEKEPRDPLLLRSPFFVLAPLGAWLLIARRAQHRWQMGIAFLLSIPFSVLYLSFAAGGGGDIKFGNFRYWLMWMPLWTVLAVVAATGGLDRVRRLTQPPSGPDR